MPDFNKLPYLLHSQGDNDKPEKIRGCMKLVRFGSFVQEEVHGYDSTFVRTSLRRRRVTRSGPTCSCCTKTQGCCGAGTGGRQPVGNISIFYMALRLFSDRRLSEQLLSNRTYPNHNSNPNQSIDIFTLLCLIN